MGKRMLSLLLAVFMVMSLLPMTAFAAEEEAPQEAAEPAEAVIVLVEEPAAGPEEPGPEPEEEPAAEPAEEPVAEPEEPAEEPVTEPEEPAAEPAEEPEEPEEPAAEEPVGETIPEAPAADGGTEEKTVSGTYNQTAARSMLSMINSFRTGSNAWYWNEDDTTKTVFNTGSGTYLDELVYDYDLEQIAMQRAMEIAVSFSHTRPNGQPCFSLTYNGTQTWGENIAAGYTSASSVFNAWCEENEKYSGQGHRRNMLSEDFTAIGIACFTCDGVTYWVQEFGYEPSGAAPTEANNGKASGSISLYVANDVVPINAATFPDETFRACVSYYHDTDRSGGLSEEEIAATEYIDCGAVPIADLTGIEYFTELTYLDCASCGLTGLDVSRNKKLEYLDCSDNQLTSLDVTQNPELIVLGCGSNQLTSLDVTQNPALIILDCRINSITSLDVTRNAALIGLNCAYNPMTALNVTENPQLYELVCVGTSIKFLNLSANTALASLKCYYTDIKTLDISGCPELIYLWENGTKDPDAADDGVAYYYIMYDEDTDVPYALALGYDEDVTLITEKEPNPGGSRLKGDVNGDGKVTIADVVRLAEYVNARGEGVEAVEGSTDVNGDGKVTIADVVRLAEYVNARGQGVVIY